MSTAVLEFGESLAGFVINASNVAIPDDVSKGDFYGVQRAANAYHKKFLPQDRSIAVDGTIGSKTVLAVNTAFTNLRERTGARQTFFDVESLANAAHATALKLASAAGVRANFLVPTTRAPTAPSPPPAPGPQPDFSVPPAPPPAPGIAPDATTPPPTPPTPKKTGTGVKIAIGVGAGVVGLAVLSRMVGR